MEDRQQASLELSREIVDDTELSRISPQSILLKALRLARLTEDASPEVWIRFELNGYPNTPEGRVWMLCFGRLASKDATTGHWMPLAGVAGTIAAMQAELQTLQVPNVNFAPSSANPNEFVGG